MSRSVPLVLIQTPARPADDLAGFVTDLEQRSRHWHPATLVAYPELHLCGAPSGESLDEAGLMEAVAEPLDGPRDRTLAQIAGDLGLWLAPGSVCERGEDGRFYNTAVVYSPQGRRVAAYRKIFPWRPYETTAPGTRFVVFDMDGYGRVGLSICYDAWFPEVSRHLAWMGAELIINVVQTSTNDRAQETVLARANAITNQVFVASVNAAGPTGQGRSLLVDPEGRVRTEAVADESVALNDVIDLDEVIKVRRYGTLGLNRLWQQFTEADEPIELPMYHGKIDPATWSGQSMMAPHQAK